MDTDFWTGVNGGNGDRFFREFREWTRIHPVNSGGQEEGDGKFKKQNLKFKQMTVELAKGEVDAEAVEPWAAGGKLIPNNLLKMLIQDECHALAANTAAA